MPLLKNAETTQLEIINMKKSLVLLLLIVAVAVKAQSKDEKAVIEKTYLLSHTVFGTKDSLTFEKLFAKNATYGHSGGKLQNRKEAIDGATSNKSTYSDTAVSNISVIISGTTSIVRYLFVANEHTADGKIVPLHFSMMLVWVKENGDWKLMGRQAVKLV
jgi:ketosteroid isomerase-like protein